MCCASLRARPPRSRAATADWTICWTAGVSAGAASLDLAAARHARTAHRSAGDMLDAVRERSIKAALGFDAVVGNFASPYRRYATSCCTTASAKSRPARQVGHASAHGADHPGDGAEARHVAWNHDGAEVARVLVKGGRRGVVLANEQRSRHEPSPRTSSRACST